MCGRFACSRIPEPLIEDLSLEEVSGFEARYNIAPTQKAVSVICESGKACPVLLMMTWGLSPSWSSKKIINARVETVSEKPSFRSSFLHRRCLIPADGYYEWKSVKSGKQAYFIRPGESESFIFAGIWEESEEGGQGIRNSYH